MNEPRFLTQFPGVHARLLEAEILSETACNRVTGVVVTGNQDGAHYVISDGLCDIGYIIPGQS